MIKWLVITGYKAYELGIFSREHPGIPIIKKAIKRQLIPLIEDGLEWIILSGQTGVEMWAAEVVIDLKTEYLELKYAVITPFLGQEELWSEQNKEKYEEIIMFADYHVSVTNKPYTGPWQYTEKNKLFLRNSDALLMVYDEEKEGSPKYMKQLAECYAEKHEYPIYTINFYDLQSLVEEEMYGYGPE